MKLGAEPKKLAVLIGLLVVAALTYYFMSADSPAPATVTARATNRTPVAVIPAPSANAPVRRARNQSLIKEFKLSLGAKDPKDRPDPATIDPTLRLDLLAKVQNIEVGAPGRDVF